MKDKAVGSYVTTDTVCGAPCGFSGADDTRACDLSSSICGALCDFCSALCELSGADETRVAPCDLSGAGDAVWSGQATANPAAVEFLGLPERVCNVAAMA